MWQARYLSQKCTKKVNCMLTPKYGKSTVTKKINLSIGNEQKFNQQKNFLYIMFKLLLSLCVYGGHRHQNNKIIKQHRSTQLCVDAAFRFYSTPLYFGIPGSHITLDGHQREYKLQEQLFKQTGSSITLHPNLHYKILVQGNFSQVFKLKMCQHIIASVLVTNKIERYGELWIK